jgi:hypothetical protein
MFVLQKVAYFKAFALNSVHLGPGKSRFAKRELPRQFLAIPSPH